MAFSCLVDLLIFTTDSYKEGSATTIRLELTMSDTVRPPLSKKVFPVRRVAAETATRSGEYIYFFFPKFHFL